MARTFNMHEAKTHLSRIVEKVLRGEEIIIARSGHPVVKVVAYEPPPRKVAATGSMKGQVWISDDFDAPIDDFFEALQNPTITNKRSRKESN